MYIKIICVNSQIKYTFHFNILSIYINYIYLYVCKNETLIKSRKMTFRRAEDDNFTSRFTNGLELTLLEKLLNKH